MKVGNPVETAFVRADNSRESVTMPADPTALAHDILQRVADTEHVATSDENAELSLEQAAMILGVSSPLVVQRMADGRLPFRRVGTRRRARLRDVLRLREHEQALREPLGRLAADTEDLSATHGLRAAPHPLRRLTGRAVSPRPLRRLGIRAGRFFAALSMS